MFNASYLMFSMKGELTAQTTAGDIRSLSDGDFSQTIRRGSQAECHRVCFYL
jgi:hypothetical protein